MSKLKDLSKIHERKETRENRETPFGSVHTEIENIQDLMEETQRISIEDESVLYKSLLIRMVTCLEVYLRDKIAVIVESQDSEFEEVSDVDLTDLLDHEPDRKLSELKEIAEENLWADLVVSNYSFQNLGGIKDAFSDLGIDIITEIKKLEVNTEDGWKSIEDKNSNFMRDFTNALSKRHSLTHDLDPNRDISYNEYVTYHDAIHAFIDYIDIFVDTQILEYHGQWGKNQIRMSDTD